MRARALIWVSLGVICVVAILAYMRLAHRPGAAAVSSETSTAMAARAPRGAKTNAYTVAEATAPPRRAATAAPRDPQKPGWATMILATLLFVGLLGAGIAFMWPLSDGGGSKGTSTKPATVPNPDTNDVLGPAKNLAEILFGSNREKPVGTGGSTCRVQGKNLVDIVRRQPDRLKAICRFVTH